MSGKYRVILAFWGLLFLASSLIVLISWQPVDQGADSLQPPVTRPPGNNLESGVDNNEGKPAGGLVPIEGEGQWSLFLAAASAFVSAAGFMTTTYFAMRNDRRQTTLTQLQVQQLATEIERQRLEIDRLKREQGSKKKA
jgi:hypothetical protein